MDITPMLQTPITDVNPTPEFVTLNAATLGAATPNAITPDAGSSTQVIKEEPLDDSNESHAWPFTTGQAISLFEGEDEDMDDLGSPRPISTPEKGNIDKSGEERRLAAQRKFVHMRNVLQQPKDSPSPAVSLLNRRVQMKDPMAAKFAKAKQTFERKKRAGTITLEQEIEWMKLQSKEQSRLRKVKLDEEYDQSSSDEDDDDGNGDDDIDEGLFIPEFSEVVSNQKTAKPKKRGRKRKNLESDDEEAPPSRKRARPSKTVKAGRKVPGTAYNEGDLEDLIEEVKRQSVKPRKTATPRAATSNTKSKGSKRSKGPQMTNLESIMGTDVFGDAARVEHLRNQPTFEPTSRRDDALKQLIASVPTDDKDAKKSVNSDTKFLHEAIKSFTGQQAVKPGPNGTWTLKGMKSHLKAFQVLGVAFMRRREEATAKPNGGILADQMGLGKTVMCLANMVNGRPKDESRTKTTLIVASPALITQWSDEIRKHCQMGKDAKKHGLENFIQYRAGHRVEGSDIMSVLTSADVVLTTYHEVAKSYPKPDVPLNLVTSEEKSGWWTKHYEEHKGPLHRIRFHRIVLDEAHAIKNHLSRTSNACRALDATHRWAITGTPIMNNLKEFYPYFRFLREPNTGSYKIFKENFCTPGDADGSSRLAVFLRKLMLRRTHRDQFLSARLLDIPTPKDHTAWLEFNNVERQVYEIVKRRFIQRINAISKSGELEKQYKHIFTMVLRLRQLCSHSLLIQGTVVDLLEREDFEKLHSITANDDQGVTDEGGSLLIHLRHVLRNNAGVKSIDGGPLGAVITSSESVSTDMVDVGNWGKLTGGTHGLSFRFRKYLNALKESEHWEGITQRTTCTGCRQKPADPQVTSCFHIYCLQCLKDLQHLAARRGHDQARCSECGDAYISTQPCEGLDSFDAVRNSRSERDQSQSTQKSRSKKGDRDMQSWIDMVGEVLPSAKTAAVKSQILEWIAEDQPTKDKTKATNLDETSSVRSEATGATRHPTTVNSEAPNGVITDEEGAKEAQEPPTTKIVIYTQFLPMVKILSRVCDTEGWGYVKYTGEMSHEARSKAIVQFRDMRSKRIMLASLRAGGEGLNLVMATRVICLDPWWNNAVEQQAFCRVYRIGQEKETRMTRFLIKNTIDENMFSLQERKKIEIDTVMADAKNKTSLSVEDLMRLFGDVGEDEDGKPFIFAAGSGDMDHNRLADVDDEDEENFMGNEE